MKALNRTARFLMAVEDKLLLIVFVLCFLCGLYALYDSYMVYNGTNDDSILKYKPGYENLLEQDDKKMLDCMRFWLTIDDTSIDDPVMQGKDNMEFLNMDPFGDYALAGSLFLDSRNKPDLSDPYLLVYGHHMSHGAMFGALDAFLQKEYFYAHKKGTVNIDGKDYTIRIFAIVETDAKNKTVFAPTEEPEKTMPYIKENALIYDKSNEPRGTEKLLGMSTCKYPDTLDRTILYAAIEKFDKREGVQDDSGNSQVKEKQVNTTITPAPAIPVNEGNNEPEQEEIKAETTEEELPMPVSVTEKDTGNETDNAYGDNTQERQSPDPWYDPSLPVEVVIREIQEESDG